MSFRIDARCNGCSACASQCPTTAIYGTFKGRYAVNNWLCIDCGVCGRVCPREAVYDEHGHLAHRVPRGQRPHPVVDANTCTGCELCADVCPSHCIAMVGQAYNGIALLVEPERCTGCGECVTICSKEAVKMVPLDLQHFDPEAERQRLQEIVAPASEEDTETPGAQKASGG